MAGMDRDFSERDRKVLDVTFNSAGESVNAGWGWRIPRNPERVKGEYTEAEPIEWKYPRTGVRMMKRDLWGIHLRYDGWAATDESWNDAGMSSARFDLPDCRKIIVGGGSMGADPHYCIRIVRVEVKENL